MTPALLSGTTRPCPECGSQTTLQVEREGWRLYQSGELIQDALPGLDRVERERLISGTCGPCWAALWKEE